MFMEKVWAKGLDSIPKARNRNASFACSKLRFVSNPHCSRNGSPNRMRVLLLCFSLVASTLNGQSFVQRSGTHLTLDNSTFRFSGPNVEWLGLEGYGPHDPIGPRYPSHFEIDDVLATAAEMGAGVVRSQTMGDTVGCPLCIEPSLGRFNDAAFAASDYAVAAAHKYGMRLIIPLVGDCATCVGGGLGQYVAWNNKQSLQDFFTDPAIIAD